MKRRSYQSTLSYRQRGAATLVVVMMLFLVMALLAAYANRSLMFEQRISNSYYRASISQEMAAAGVEWSVALLNGPAIDEACRPVTTGGVRFADRYLAITPEDRGIKPNGASGGFAADCTRVADGWTCRCPLLGHRQVPDPVDSAALIPSFGISIQPVADGSGTVQISAQGCTSSVADYCSDAETNTKNYLGLSREIALIALVSAVRSPPAAPLIIKGALTSGAGLGLHNTDARSAGLLVVAGGGLSNDLVDSRLDSVPGTATSLAKISGDQTLVNASTDDVFKMFMGAAPARYKQHPSLRVVACGDGDCAGALQSAYDVGKRILLVQGHLVISSNKTLGSPTDPVVVIATGGVTLRGAFQFNGMLVSQGDLDWSNTSGLTSLVTGTVLVEGDMTTGGSGMDITYKQSIADQLRNRVGSYVRVPGSWLDDGNGN